MRPNRFRGLRRRLSYANVMATLAFFFALTGGAMAGAKYLTASDPINAGDLAGSTYGNPLIAAGKVTSGKIADGAITSSKFDANATAPNATNVGGLNTVIASHTESLDPSSGTIFFLTCPSDRIAVHADQSGAPDIGFSFATYTPSGTYDRQSYAVTVFNHNTTEPEEGTVKLSCFGA